MIFESKNPATGLVTATFAEPGPAEIGQTLELASDAFLRWWHSPLAQRAALLQKLADLLERDAEQLGRLMALEMGKPLKQGTTEAQKCAWVCRYYADNGESFLQDLSIPTEFRKSYVTFQPVGVVFSIMPWNFPFWQAIRFAAPAIMAGNTILLKHAPNVPRSARAIEQLFLEAGFEPGVFSQLMVDIDKIPGILAHPAVQGVSFTGSTVAGKKVAALAGQHMKRAVLELGGSDPYLVFPGADLEKTVETCLNARLVNTGQSCVAGKRFIIHSSLYRDFEELFTEKMKKKTMADPLTSPDLGPMARLDLRDEIHRQVQTSIANGGRLLCGGEVPAGTGYYYPATAIGNAGKGMPVWDQETFGPVAALCPFETEAEALALAADTPFGLGAALFGPDTDYLEKLAREYIPSGMVAINEQIKSDPRLPFGGIKDSGYGRELSIFGIREFVNVKTIVAN